MIARKILQIGRTPPVSKQIVGVNEHGLLVGESHPNAKLSDADCDLIRELNEQGVGYGKLAEKFEVPKSTIASIVKCRRRGQYPVRWRERGARPHKQ